MKLETDNQRDTAIVLVPSDVFAAATAPRASASRMRTRGDFDGPRRSAAKRGRARNGATAPRLRSRGLVGRAPHSTETTLPDAP
jgi:hypothetical protein